MKMVMMRMIQEYILVEFKMLKVIILLRICQNQILALCNSASNLRVLDFLPDLNNHN